MGRGKKITEREGQRRGSNSYSIMSFHVLFLRGHFSNMVPVPIMGRGVKAHRQREGF